MKAKGVVLVPTLSVFEVFYEAASKHPELLTPGTAANGPALIRGDYLTCLIRAGWGLRVSPNNDLIIEVA